MVDFQSRDTRRGPTDDEESESEADSSADGAEASEDATDANGRASEADEDAATETDDVAGTPTAENGPETGDPLAEDAGPGEAADADARADESRPADAATDAHADESVGVETAGDPLGDPTETADNTDETGEAGDNADETVESEGEVTSSGPEQAATEAAPQATPSRSVDVAVVTVAGDRDALEDTVTAAFEAAGHAVVRRERLRGGYDGIQEMVDTLVGGEAVDVVVTVGGVGLAADEMAVEAVHPLLEKALPGFGEAFRSRLADHVGTGIVGVRSAAGVSDGTLVFCLPGDAEAAALAVREILATEAPVLVDQLDG